MRQPVRQLHPAARNPRVVLAAERERPVGGEGLARLFDPGLAGEHLAGQDQRLGAGAAFGEAAVHQELVGGGKMTDRAFHDAVLQSGTMPVEMVRALLARQPLTANYAAQWKFAGPLQ